MGNIKSKPTYKEKLKAERLYKKKLIKKGNQLFKEVCFKLYGNKCELTGGNYRLSVHHYYPRGLYGYLVYEPLNGIVLAFPPHFAHHHRGDPRIHEQIRAKRGEKWWTALQEKVQDKPHQGYKTTQWLEEQIAKLKKILE